MTDVKVMEAYRLPKPLAEQFGEISHKIHITKTAIIQEFVEGFCQRILESNIFNNQHDFSANSPVKTVTTKSFNEFNYTTKLTSQQNKLTQVIS